MKAFTVRIDEELHKELKIMLINKGESIQNYVINKIKEDLAKENKK